MHCLAPVSSGSASPQRAGNCSGVLGVVRAIGVLVSEGRVQGPPKGYKEGPHCAAPLQPVPNNHVCEKDNYLCDRYVILVREIADRVTACSYLCVEVLLCTDCPCGLAKATCKDPVLQIPSMSIASWQQPSEMLLEYWCISVVPSKGPEMMNNQSLYQAVRSRLHFSQVAAWWSRSKGTDPSYITTRVVSFSEDNLRKFRETPSEHTFPLAACGDGNSVKVTVWALPRVEDVPVLACPIHPIFEKEDEGAARALTPTKNVLMPVTNSNPEALVLPTLVDDRLQTPCNEPGKHHCRCEEEDGCPPSPSVRANGERKRRRSLPRGPDLIPTTNSHAPVASIFALSSVYEFPTDEHEKRIYRNRSLDYDSLNYNEMRYSETSIYLNGNAEAGCKIHQTRSSGLPIFSDEQSNNESLCSDNQMNVGACNNEDMSLEPSISQLSIEYQESNVEKRYKCSIEPPLDIDSSDSLWASKAFGRRQEKSPKFTKRDCLIRQEKTDPVIGSGPTLLQKNNEPTVEKTSSSFTTVLQNSIGNINWTTSTISGKETEWGSDQKGKFPFSIPVDTLPITHSKGNLVINPFSESSPFHESNPGPSTYIRCNQPKPKSKPKPKPKPKPLVQNATGNSLDKDISEDKVSASNDDLNRLMSKLKLPEETEKTKNEKGILDWISKVPSRVFNVATNNGCTEHNLKTNDAKLEEHNNTNQVKSKLNCNLELSQREFDEVLAVLRARTPAGRRRTPLRTIKRRDKLERQCDGSIPEQKSDGNGTLSNLNGNEYTTSNNVRSLAIAGFVDVKSFNNGNNQSKAYLEKRAPKEVPYKNMRVYSYNQQVERSPYVTEEKFVSKTKNERKNCCDKLEKQDAKSAECFYNVTNKADVLLGAILRTSKDPRKGISDISNGARPRTVVSTANCDSKSDVYDADVEKTKEFVRIKPFEDERILPPSLNKQINRFKQLFTKEQDKNNWETSVSEGYTSEECAANSGQSLNTSKSHALRDSYLLHKNSKENRVKRRIDFSNLPESTQWPDNRNESLIANTEGCLSTNSVYQNPLSRGPNCETSDYFSDKMKEFRSPMPDREVTVEESRYFTPNPQKCSTKLRLKIDRQELKDGWQNGYADCARNYNIYDKDLSQNDDCNTSSTCDNGKKNSILPIMEEHQNHSSMENNDALDKTVPSVIEQERFRRSLGNAASMVFHSRTGLPLTSSPAPLRRGSCCFDYDSSLNSVSSKRSALFELNTPPSPGAVSLEEGDREAENTCEGEERIKRRTSSRGLPHSHALLGSFEESALNGRLEPVSTVHGFTAELGASGSFCPKHRKLPVTVFFYTLGDNDKVSTPYLAHINLGKKGYQVPRSGTIQVTLLNPLGTVVKMFVVMYDLSDMPSRSHTFLRQRTLRDKTLRYLIHLRFMSGKSGRIYLHTDIRMIICRKSDVDTASDFGAEPPKELRSFVHGPTNPKFSPRC